MNKPKLETKNPIKLIKKKKADKEEQKKIQERLEELDIIMQNIDNYDGSSMGQKEVKHVETGL